MFFIFDLDGTLTDPVLGITNSILYALKKMDRPLPERSALHDWIGPPLLQSFEQYLHSDTQTAARAVALYREYFSNRGMLENEPYPGIQAMLSSLAAEGHKICLATSKPEEYANPILEHFSLLQYFHFTAGNTLSEQRPKKEDVLRYLLEKNPQITPENALMIGDRAYDVQGARAVGLRCVGVLYGYGSHMELKKAGAWRLADDINHLQQILEETAQCEQW